MASGIIRRIDSVGRFVIPFELRRTLRLSEGDAVELFPDGDRVYFKKYEGNKSIDQLLSDIDAILPDANLSADAREKMQVLLCEMRSALKHKGP